MHIKSLVFLTETDTTIGFVAQDAAKLDRIKQRPPHKRYIKALPSLHALGRNVRIPQQHRKLVRRKRRTTLIHPNGTSYRVIDDKRHRLLIERLGWAYTTSANKSGHTYDETFATKAADALVLPLRRHGSPSAILKLGKTRLRRIR